jgi:hypothetical protein
VDVPSGGQAQRLAHDSDAGVPGTEKWWDTRPPNTFLS